jgi:pimeloyl-ACP methyl ester carboxylesterase
MTEEPAYKSVFTTSFDGLKLFARVYGKPSSLLPVIGLPGLARTSEDFHELALMLRHDRQVITLDYRGRGHSDYDPDWRHYDIRIEYNDVLNVLTALGVHQAIFAGTSRGGLITMALGAARPSLIKGVVLNDIGPVIEAKGLLRIRGYVGKLPHPQSYDQAASILRRIFGQQFPALSETDWLDFAKATWKMKAGELEANYDGALLKTLDQLNLEAPLPALWHLFEGLKPYPLLIIRGEHSDILSADTAAQMQERHQRAECYIAEGQGHAPLMKGAVNERISAFVAEVRA